MKKFLAMATLVGASFTSCVNDNEAVYQQEDSPQPITFEVAKYKPASRGEGDGTQTQADDGTIAFPTTQTFGTFAYELQDGSNTHTTFMDNVQIQHYSVTGSNGYWAAAPVTEESADEATSTKQYTWPTNAHLDFISYYPYNSNKSASSVPQIDSNDSQNKFEYKAFVVDDNNPVDLMYSDKAVYQTANTQNYGFVGVPTLFRHALSKLNFHVKALKLDNYQTAVSEAHKLSWKVTVNSIEIKSIYKKGSLTMTTSQETNSAGTTQWTNVNFTDSDTENNYDVWDVDKTENVEKAEKKWKGNQNLTTTASVYSVRTESGIESKAENYFIMPQMLDDQEIIITYTVTTIDGNSESEGESITVTKKFKDVSTAVTVWERGKSITYTIEIDPEGDIITFAPAIQDWENVNGTISI